MSLILQLNQAGQPVGWISWQVAATYHSKGLVAWEQGEIETVIRGGDNRITGKQSIIRTSSIIAIKGEGTGKRRFRQPALNNKDLFRRDRYTCAYCGSIFKELDLSRDHIIPRSKGGTDVWMNVVTCCGKCNNKKGNKMLVDAGMELLYTPYVPSKAEHLVLANRNVLYDQMEFLLAFIPAESRIRQHIKQIHPGLL